MGVCVNTAVLDIVTMRAHANTIMVVDDEPDIIDTTKRGLEKRGFKVDAFSDPQDAIDHYKPETYDRIITDIRMPKVSGFEFARIIRRKDKDAHFCFVTSFEMNASEARMVMPNLPSYCFLKKPIMPSELAEHLNNHPQEIEFSE